MAVDAQKPSSAVPAAAAASPPAQTPARSASPTASEKSRMPSTPADGTGSDVEAPAEKQAAAAPDEPPNGGFGWVIVLCVCLINIHCWGINSAYGVFLAYYLSSDYFHGATYLEFAFVGGLSVGCCLLVAPIATNTTRLFSTRTTLLIGVVLETLGLITASFATKIWHLFLSQGVCYGFGMGFLYIGSAGCIPQWFTTHRSFANAIAAAGSGIGGLIYSLASNALIQRVSLAWAFRVLGIMAFSVNTACAFIVKDRNKEVGARQIAWNLDLLKRPQYLALEGWGCFSMLAYTALLFSLPDYAQSVGLRAAQASIVGALFNLGQSVGRPTIGFFSDRVGRINMAMGTTFAAGLFSLVIWIPSNSYGVLIFFALIGGGVAGTFWATCAPLTAEIIGLQDLPAALSITWLAISLPCIFSEAIALEIRERSPSHYLAAQLFIGFMYMGGALCLLWLRVWKIRDNARCAAADKPGAEVGHVPLFKALLSWTKV